MGSRHSAAVHVIRGLSEPFVEDLQGRMSLGVHPEQHGGLLLVQRRQRGSCAVANKKDDLHTGGRPTSHCVQLIRR
jgi:hypothetical protein